MHDLADKIIVVTGASRGAGRGIAVELGAAGATVLVTGRSTRRAEAPGYDSFRAAAELARMPGSIDQTADEVTAAGGRGIPVQCDHSDPEQVRALFARVDRDHGRLDVLVNNAWGGHESFTPAAFGAPFWDQPLADWTAMFDHGVRNHVLACQRAAPLFVRQNRGLIVTTTFWDRDRYLRSSLLYDLAKASMNRLAFAVAEELRPHGVTSVAVSPGWMRTELVLACHRADETTWRDKPELAGTESPRYLGRAVVALARDPDVHARTGRVLRVADLARDYGFTDIDGRLVPAFEI